MGERQVALEWSKRVAVVAHGPYRAALRFSKFYFWLGLPTVVVLATIVGTSVFATLQQQPQVWWQIAVGVMSIAPAFFVALQSFMGYADKAEKHHAAGAKYNAVGQQLEQLMAQDDDWSMLTEIREKVDPLAEESPHIPEAVHQEMGKIPVEPLWKE